MTSGLLEVTTVVLASAVVSVPLFKRLGLGAVLGYLAAGSVLGPWGLALLTEPERMMHFAELGVVLLLFLIGLELKPSRLWTMRYAVFGLGAAQVFLCTLALGFVASQFGLPVTGAAIVGFCLSLSSTAFALQLLAERNQLNTAYGRASFGVLLFQDVIAIPILALLPLLGSSNESGFSFQSVAISTVAIAAIAVGGKFAARPFFYIVSSAKTREVFLAAALFLILGVALLMESIGLSMALGAFLAGIALSDSEYRHMLEADIEPFKGLLLGLFFISVGTSVNYGLILTQAPALFLALGLLLLVKYSVIYLLGRAAKLTPEGARQMAAVLPQAGEFAFVLFGVAATYGLLPPEQVAFLTLVVIASMAATPFIGIFERTVLSKAMSPQKLPFDAIPNEHPPVILAGFGRVGQIVARILRLQDVPFTTLEQNAEQVNTVRKFGAKVYYGDASRLDLLEAAGARSAKYFVLAIDDVAASVKTAEIVRKHFPHLKIFARARNRQHAFELLDLGVTLFWRETLASSLELAKGLLLEMGTAEQEAQAIIEKFRKHDEQTLLKQHEIHHDEQAIINYSKQSVQQLLDSVAADRQAKGVGARGE